MQADAAPYWTTAVSDVDAEDVHIRGYPLREVLGELPFAAATFLLIRGRLPSPGEARMMDGLLCAVLDYSLQKPGTMAARYCVSANPNMAAGLAAAVLSVGEYTLAPDDAGRFIAKTFAAYKASGRDRASEAVRLVAELRAQHRRVPGFGHPNFRFVDPRAAKLKRISQLAGVWSEECEWYVAVHSAFIEAADKPDLVINDVGMMAAIMVGMGFTPAEMTGIAVLSSLPGVIAHVSEELQTEVRIRTVPEGSASYARERRDLERDLAHAGWPSADGAGKGGRS
ncbi:MAG: citryl-CoA lyase [Alphaproteobacteria bacterium]